jgi:AdoMet-dependent heme synthase
MLSESKQTCPQLNNLSWNLTSFCNLQCLHCYVDASCYPQNKTLFDEKSVKRIAKEAKQLGIKSIFLAGGEPLLLEELPKFIRIIHNENLSPCVCSNLTTITKEKAKILHDAGLEMLSVGIDHVEEKQLNKFRGENVYKRVIQGIAICREANIPVNIDFTLTNLTKETVNNIHEFGLQHGCFQVAMKRYVPEGRGFKNKDKLLMDPANYRKCLVTWSKKSAMFSGRIRSFVHDPMYLVVLQELGCLDEKSDSEFGCKAWTTAGWLGISPDGRVHPCPLMRGFNLGNILKVPLTEIATRENDQLAVRTTPKGCVGCSAEHVCHGGCKATRIRTNGLESRDIMCWKKC